MRAEHHYANRLGWIRAAVLGANDGIISMAGLVVGLEATELSTGAVSIATWSALIAGALSMGVGEYISVSSQADSEKYDVLREKRALEQFPEQELRELTQAYVAKGISPALAGQVAKELTQVDALSVHVKEELNYDTDHRAKPFQAAVYSFLAFLVGGVIPAACIFFDYRNLVYPITIMALSMLGCFSAKLGGVPPLKPTFRVVILGLSVMLMTHLLGALYV
jgi:VIT1/CCC1 family predicted Fe2+/Mn2+ transporter